MVALGRLNVAASRRYPGYQRKWAVYSPAAKMYCAGDQRRKKYLGDDDGSDGLGVKLGES
jgi:hypothetical protein